MRKFHKCIAAAAALVWMASCGGGAEDGIASLEWLKSNNALLQMKAIDFAAEERESAAMPGLIVLLDSPIEEVRLKSVFALGRIGSQEAVPALIERLDDESLDIRREAVTSLGKLKNPAAIHSLVLLLDSEELELAVIWAIGNIGDSRSIPILNDLLAGEDPYVRYNASRALAKIR
ncbi:MAG: HEAT repeat domain-containing protein [Candidatus Tritonobacter lacicola]|nr:HEAT repeat domain-containing protein [Candidatus Tritonobacter lacicola]